MVKDFNSSDGGGVNVDCSFMTNADVPLLALNEIISVSINPWTGISLHDFDFKENGVFITTSSLWDPSYHFNEIIFDIQPHEWLHVHTDIFDPENWTQEFFD